MSAAFALELSHVDVGAEGRTGVGVVEKKNFVGTLVRRKFLGGVADDMPDEKVQARGRFAMLENVQESVEERGLSRAFAAKHVEQNPNCVHNSDRRKSAADNTVTQNATHGKTSDDPVWLAIKDGPGRLLQLEQRPRAVGQERHDAVQRGGAAAIHQQKCFRAGIEMLQAISRVNGSSFAKCYGVTLNL